MDLSVIIVSYNVRHFLEQCLVTVLKAGRDFDTEIIVVDNNSSDGSAGMVQSRFPGIIVIANTDNKGFAAANNQALKIAGGKYVLLLNPDTLVEEDIFSKCIGFMESHPDAGAAGVKMINGKGMVVPESKRAFPAPRTALFKVTGLSYIFPKSRIFNSYYLGHLDSNAIGKADVLSGAFMFLRKEAINKTGFLDEDYFMHGEDIDYSFKLKKAGFTNYYFPAGRIIHFKGQSTDRENFRNIACFFKSMLIFTGKNLNNHSRQIMILPVYAAIWLRSGLSVVRRLKSWLFSPVSRHIHYRNIRTAVVSDTIGFERISGLLGENRSHHQVCGRISTDKSENGRHLLGNIEEVTDILKNNDIEEIIFSTRSLGIGRIIDYSQLISDSGVKMRFASEKEEFIFGTGYVFPC